MSRIPSNVWDELGRAGIRPSDVMAWPWPVLEQIIRSMSLEGVTTITRPSFVILDETEGGQAH